jgi:uncharacterized heparinase superfamily protein
MQSEHAMNMPNSAGQYISGKQRIEGAIVEGSKASGLAIQSQNMQWNGGKKLSSLPWSSELAIAAGGNTAKAVLTREQVVDSWELLDGRTSEPVCGRLWRN